MWSTSRVLLTAALTLIPLTVNAVPTWDVFSSKVTNGDLVTGATAIEAIATGNAADQWPRYLSVAANVGEAGNAIITPTPVPASFYISPRDGQLYQMINQTSILYVNILNTTATPSRRDPSAQQHPLGDAYAQARLELALAPDTPHNPLKLEISRRRAPGAQPGAWHWMGSMLYFEDRAGRTNQGIYYQCADRDGPHGLYMFMAPSPTPAGCQIVTLHSWSVEGRR